MNKKTCLVNRETLKKTKKQFVQNTINDYDKIMTKVHKEVGRSTINLQSGTEVAVQKVPGTKSTSTQYQKEYFLEREDQSLINIEKK